MTRSSVHTSDRTWWVPLAFVVLVLVALVLTPIVINARLSRLRAANDVRNRSRVLVNDMEADVASGLLQSRSDRQASVAHAASDAAELTALARDIDSESLQRATRLRSFLSLPQTESVSREAALAFFADAESLDTHVTHLFDAERTELRGMQLLNVKAAAVLSALALVAVAAVFSAGQRVRRVARELEQERAALAQSIEERTALIRGITHDVKNPLGAAAGFADLLEDGIAGDLRPEQRVMVGRIRKLVTETLATISDLLRVERDGTATADVKTGLVDVSALMTDIVGDFQPMTLEKRLTVEVEPPPAPVVVETDGQRLRHILDNLVSNAVKYTPAGGIVRVGFEVQDGNGSGGRHVRIEVRDSGPGVPRELRDRIFEEFYRVESSAKTVAGHGLGLAISKRLSRELGADITVGDAPEGGSRFSLLLPISQSGHTRL